MFFLASCQGSPPPEATTAESNPMPKAEPLADALDEAKRRSGFYGSAEAKKTWDAERKHCPGPLDGSELVGQVAPEWSFSEWAHGEPRALASLRGRVVVVRFWTAPDCPFCSKTMPALQALSEELKGEPVTFVGAFHGKPNARFADLSAPRETADASGIDFPIAHDRDWKTLSAWWLEPGHRHATSVTFVIGADGRYLHVHPGPVFHPSDDPKEAEENRAYLAVAAAVRAGLSAHRTLAADARWRREHVASLAGVSGER